MNAKRSLVVQASCLPDAAETPAPQILGALLIAIAMLSAIGCQDSTLPAAAQPVSPPVSTSSSSSTATNPATDPGRSARPALPARPQGIREITFDTVKLNMKKEDPFTRSLITPAVAKLDGNRVRIRGFILPPFQQTGLTRFVLVRDNMACCFGPGAAIYDSMVVDLKPGMTIDYQVSPVAVVGTFNIREVEGVAGRPISIYHVTAEKVE
jgi:hypothetical protein